MNRSLAEAKEIQAKFEEEIFKPNFGIVSVGLGVSKTENDYTLELILEHDKVKDSLPSFYEGLELVIETISGVNIFGF